MTLCSSLEMLNTIRPHPFRLLIWQWCADHYVVSFKTGIRADLELYALIRRPMLAYHGSGSAPRDFR